MAVTVDSDTVSMHLLNYQYTIKKFWGAHSIPPKVTCSGDPPPLNLTEIPSPL